MGGGRWRNLHSMLKFKIYGIHGKTKYLVGSRKLEYITSLRSGLSIILSSWQPKAQSSVSLWHDVPTPRCEYAATVSIMIGDRRRQASANRR